MSDTPPEIIRAVADTLRYLAGNGLTWTSDDLADWATDVEGALVYPDRACCSMCQEVTCDDDCPMFPHRHPGERP